MRKKSLRENELFETLADLAVNRHLPTEAEEKLVPFRAKEFSLRLVFVSASRTFGNRFDPVYEQGYAVICKPEGETLEVSILLPPDENARVDALSPDDTFEAKVTLLDFDTLYQRAVFGQAIEDSVEIEQEEEAPVDPEEQEEGEKVEEEPLEELEEEAPEPAPAEVPLEADPPVEAPTPQPAPKEAVEEQIPPTKPPAPAAARPKPEPRAPSRRESRPSRSAKKKKNTLLHIKEALSENILRLKPGSCPNGHGLLTRYHKGKMYCKVCGWPSHRNPSKPVASSETNEEKSEFMGCVRFIIGAFILFIILKSCA